VRKAHNPCRRRHGHRHRHRKWSAAVRIFIRLLAVWSPAISPLITRLPLSPLRLHRSSNVTLLSPLFLSLRLISPHFYLLHAHIARICVPGARRWFHCSVCRAALLDPIPGAAALCPQREPKGARKGRGRGSRRRARRRRPARAPSDRLVARRPLRRVAAGTAREDRNAPSAPHRARARHQASKCPVCPGSTK
jgi:hypothetical protein